MPPVPTDPTPPTPVFEPPGTAPGGRAAAMARHPAGGRRVPAGPAPGATPLPFAAAVALLTGPWRVSDPDGFAAAMTGAPAVAGHSVVDVARRPGEPEPVLDGPAGRALTGATRRPLDVRWVAATAGGHLYVEARAEAPATAGEPELFVVAHLVEGISPAGRRRPARAGGDHSWLVVLVGDGTGGVAAAVRALLGCPSGARCCPPPAASLRLPLTALRERLLAPAVDAELPAPPGAGVVLPFRPRPSGATPKLGPPGRPARAPDTATDTDRGYA